MALSTSEETNNNIVVSCNHDELPHDFYDISIHWIYKAKLLKILRFIRNKLIIIFTAVIGRNLMNKTSKFVNNIFYQ